MPAVKRLRLYEMYFRNAESFDDLEELVREANKEMLRTALGMADALHVAAASLLSADEFITGEGPNKPIYKNTLVKVVRFTV